MRKKTKVNVHAEKEWGAKRTTDRKYNVTYMERLK